MAFDEAAVNTFVDNVASHAASLGIFRQVSFHEPKSPPGSGLRYSVWVQLMEPIGPASGLAIGSGYVVVTGRIYSNMLQKPEDDIDPAILRVATTLIKAYAGDFNFGGTARNVDVFGMYGEKLRARAGYVTVGGGMYRVMDITLPVIFNDMWDLTP